MKNTYIINIISGPSSGKTTLACLLFAKLKMKQWSIEYVQEYAKHLVWTKKFNTLNKQHLVSKYQYNLFKSMFGVVDFIITDGALINGIIYNQLNKDNLSNITKTEKQILKYIQSCNNINIFLERNPSHKYEYEGRIQTYTEALKVDNMLLDTLNFHNIKYKKFLSDESLIEEIISYIESFERG